VLSKSRSTLQTQGFDAPTEHMDDRDILLGGIRERGLVYDAQGMQAAGELFGHHRGTVVGHQRARQSAALQGLAESVHQALGSFVEIPLDVTGQAGAVIENRQCHGLGPGAGASQDFARAVVEVQMQQAADMIDFEAAGFARLAVGFGVDLPRA